MQAFHNQQAAASFRPLTMLVLASATAAALSAAPVAQAGGFPEHAVTLVVGYSPGGGVDAVARILSKSLSSALGQPVVIENRPGAGASIAAYDVARAAPDGYTLEVGDAALVTSPRLLKDIHYDVKRDFKVVSILTSSPLVLSVNTGSLAKTVNDLSTLAASSPRGYSFSSAGIGSTPHLAGELLKLKAGANFTHVPYRSSGPAMTDLVAGQLDFSFSTIAAALPFIRDNRLRAVATSGLKRSPQFPDVPTVAESYPGFDIEFFTVLVAPAKTPPEVLAKLNDAVRSAWASPEAKAALDKIGETAAAMPQADSTVFLHNQEKKFGDLIAGANIKVE
jgi:tripartite-type tricarboxylate transporter receptor subunit TctC